MGEENPIIFIEYVVHKPELLVGCQIKHRFKSDRELVWYEGTVLQMDSETKEFQVAYDEKLIEILLQLVNRMLFSVVGE